MKKLIIVLFALVMPLLCAAQEENTPGKKFSVNTNSFWQNWYLQGGVQLTSSDTRKTTQIAMSLGKWFTPGIGTRLKLNGFNGKYEKVENTAFDASVYRQGDFKYLTLTGDVMFNLTNLLVGFKEQHIWGCIPFVGAGFSRNCDANVCGMAFTYGVLNEFRLCRNLSAHLELGWQRAENAFSTNLYYAKAEGWGSHDCSFYTEIGLTFRIGKRPEWKKAADLDAIRSQYEAEIEAYKAQAEDAEAEIQRLMEGGTDPLPDAPEVDE